MSFFLKKKKKTFYMYLQERALVLKKKKKQNLSHLHISNVPVSIATHQFVVLVALARTDVT